MDVLMPQLGETVAEGKISKWFVKAGDTVQPGQNLFEIETDKVSMEVPAITAGTLAAIHVRAGDVARVGAVVAIIQGKGETVSTEQPAKVAQQAPLTPAKAGVQSQAIESSTTPAVARDMEPFREVRSPDRNYGPARLAGGTVVTPLARRLAGEAGIDLANIKGSGPRGRIVARDIQDLSDNERSGGIARPTNSLVGLSNAKGSVDEALQAAVVLTADIALSAALTLCAEVEAIALADIITKAWAVALRRITPEAQTGIAITHAGTRAVLSDAANKSLTGISLARRDDTGDGPAASAISIPDVPGIVSVTDALQVPQTTLLSIGASRRAPVEAPDGSVRFVDVMTATLACDPRAVDARRGAELLAAFKGYVERPVTMIV